MDCVSGNVNVLEVDQYQKRITMQAVSDPRKLVSESVPSCTVTVEERHSSK
jgi:hypothetical protein